VTNKLVVMIRDTKHYVLFGMVLLSASSFSESGNIYRYGVIFSAFLLLLIALVMKHIIQRPTTESGPLFFFKLSLMLFIVGGVTSLYFYGSSYPKLILLLSIVSAYVSVLFERARVPVDDELLDKLKAHIRRLFWLFLVFMILVALAAFSQLPFFILMVKVYAFVYAVCFLFPVFLYLKAVFWAGNKTTP